MANSYDRAKKVQIDPNRIVWVSNHRLNEKAVRGYMRNPNLKKSSAAGGDGDPFVVIDKNGTPRGFNGKHRAEAARRQHRQLAARVHDERVSGPAVAPGCLGLLLTWALCAALLAAAALAWIAA